MNKTLYVLSAERPQWYDRGSWFTHKVVAISHNKESLKEIATNDAFKIDDPLEEWEDDGEVCYTCSDSGENKWVITKIGEKE